MKPYAVVAVWFALLLGLLAARQPPAAPPSPTVGIAALPTITDAPTPAPDTPTPTATATPTVAPTRTPKPTATPMPTPVLLSGRIVFVTYREDAEGDGSLTSLDNGGIITLDLLTGETRELTDGAGWGPAWSPDGQQIAFVLSLGGNHGEELYVIDSDGGSLRRLTTTAERETAPSWSPNGEEIVYLLFWWDDARGYFVGDLYVMNVASGVTRQLTDTPGLEWEPHWSPDGRFIAYSRETFRPELKRGREEIYLLDVSSGEEWMLTESLLLASRQDFMEPQWPECQPLTISFTVVEVSTSELDAEAGFYVALYELEWQGDRPVLTLRGRFGSNPFILNNYAWGPSCEWYITAEYPGLLARPMTLEQRTLGPPEVQLGDAVVLMDAPTTSMMMPDWTP